jgi:methionyl-tRNA synthetase
MNKDTFYITSTIFYPNAQLHIGHVYTMTVCDIISRYQKLIGNDAYFLTGSDENTAKIVKAAKEKGQDVESFLSEITTSFKKLYKDLNISYDEFIQTTNKEKHWPGAIKMWENLTESGDIYKSKYSGLYCPQCEAFYTDKEVTGGTCPLHGVKLEKLEEENYFFKLSKYTAEIKKRIENNELEISPSTRRNEILAQLERGLDDISFSRPAHTVSHGIPVPNDSSQVLYVWPDALTSYISGVGYGTNEEKFAKYWPADIHVIGKDILRFHAAIWPAMLLSAGLSLPKKLLVHGLITSGGQKMSKSIGNVIDPYELINKYGGEAVRYYIARKISLFEDGEMTVSSFHEAYNGDLANGLGNLVSRIMTLAENNLPEPVTVPEKSIPDEFKNALDKLDINAASNIVWEKIAELDKEIQEKKPWETKDKEVISEFAIKLYTIARMLNPIMPETNIKIKALVRANKTPDRPLFPRLNA